MTDTKINTQTHPTEVELAGLLAGTLSGDVKDRLESHIAGCDVCLASIVSGYESVAKFRKGNIFTTGVSFMKKFNLYLVGAIISFALSFVMPRFFIQLLVATLLLGIKWIIDNKSTKMLIMIYEAWKHGGEHEASRILEKYDLSSKKRF